MKVTLTLRQLKSSLTNLQKCQIKAHLGDLYKIVSAESILQGGSCQFMEINTVELNSDPTVVSFDLVIDGIVIAHISLFPEEAVRKTEVALEPSHGDRNFYKLVYELKMEATGQSAGQAETLKKLRRRKTLEEETDNVPSLDEKGKIKYLQLSKMTYVFAKRLDPMVKMSNALEKVLLWKTPEHTIGLGILLTLFVLFPKTSIILGCLMLIFGRNYIIRGVQTIIPQQEISRRLLPPDENLGFLYRTMELYCDIYEKISQFLQSDDRTKIITIIEVICKFGIVVSVILLIFPLEVLIVMGIWSALFLTSETGKRFLNYALPKLLHYNRALDKMLKNVSKSAIGMTLTSESSSRLLKTFYIYKYDRWWMDFKWRDVCWSNQDKSLDLQARIHPPQGYRWIKEWQVQKSINTDSEGYEYTNDLSGGRYTPYYKVIYPIRRRKWYRTCVKISEDREGDASMSPRKAISEIKTD